MKRFNKNVLIVLFIIAAILGKVVRYTIMKETLVDWAAGYSFVDNIEERTEKFSLTFGRDAGTATQNAGGNALALFTAIDFFRLHSYESFEVYISIIWNIILFFIIFHARKSINMIELLFLLFSIAVLNIWDFCLAKEPVQMLYFVFMFFILRQNKLSDRAKFIGCLIVYFFSAITFRTYYLAMIFFMIIFCIIYTAIFKRIKKISFKHAIIILLISYASFAILLLFMKRFSVSYYGELIWVRLKEYKHANTSINSIFKSSNVYILALDLLVLLFRLLFPIELLRLGPKYFLFTIYQIMITYIIIKNIRNVRDISINKKVALCIFIAFVFGSALFEPDFGSWVRHEAVTFPIIILLTNVIKEKEYDEIE